jgi:hypothetical protein
MGCQRGSASLLAPWTWLVLSSVDCRQDTSFGHTESVSFLPFKERATNSQNRKCIDMHRIKNPSGNP